GKPIHWRASVAIGGSPGAANSSPVGVIIHEVVANTDSAIAGDAIELRNVTSESINIGGWYLSDSANDLQKYMIPLGMVLPAGAVVVFDETDFNPTPTAPQPH